MGPARSGARVNLFFKEISEPASTFLSMRIATSQPTLKSAISHPFKPGQPLDKLDDMLSKGEIASYVQEDGQIKVETTPGTDIARLDGALTQPATLPLLTKASQLFVPADPKRSYMNSAMMATVGTHATVGGLWLLPKQYVPFTLGTTLLGAVAGVPQRWRGNGDKFLPLPLQNLGKLLEAPSSDGLRQLIKDSPLLLAV